MWKYYKCIYPKFFQNSDILLVLIVRVRSNVSRVTIVNAIWMFMDQPIPNTFPFACVFNASQKKILEKSTRFEDKNLNSIDVPLTFQAPSIWYAAVAAPRMKFGGNLKCFSSSSTSSSPLAELEKLNFQKPNQLRWWAISFRKIMKIKGRLLQLQRLRATKKYWSKLTDWLSEHRLILERKL